MNFCGGGVGQQVSEPPIVSMVLQSDPEEDYGENSHPRLDIDLSVHPTCVVKSSLPQTGKGCSNNNSSSHNITSNSHHHHHNNHHKASNNNKASKKKSTSTSSNSATKQKGTTRSRSSSRSKNRSRKSPSKTSSSYNKQKPNKGKTSNPITSQDDMISGMEIMTPTCFSRLSIDPTNNNGVSAPPSPRMLNPIIPKRSVSASAALGIPSLSQNNSRTTETLLQRLESGFRVTVHNRSDPQGNRVFLTLLQGRTCLLIRPVEGEDDDVATIKFPVRTVLRLEIGKTKSSVLNGPMYDHVNPMACFSIVVKLWTEAETYFDFETSSVIERETLISTLMVVLDQIHNNDDSLSTFSAEDGPSWSQPRSGYSIVQQGEQLPRSGRQKTPEDAVCLSPGKRTRIYDTTAPYFDDPQNGEILGTEISLVYQREDEAAAARDANDRDDADAAAKPLRQLQPGQEQDIPNPRSPPRTTRIKITKQSPNRYANRQVLNPLHNHSSKRASASRTTALEVVSEHKDDVQILEIRDDDMDGSSTTNQPPPIQVIAAEQSHSDGDARDLSFEAIPHGLPMSKIHLTPTRDSICNMSMEDSTGKKQTYVGNQQHQQQAGWCSDDICTLALKDIAETCTGIFDQHPRDASEGKENSAAERAYVEEYIAGVLGGGQNSAQCGFFQDAGDVWNINSSQHPIEGDAVPEKTRIQNRASRLNAQAMRLRALRNEMTFAAALKRSKEKMHYVQTVHSFDDVAYSDRLRQAQERSVNRLHSSALMERVMGSMVLKEPLMEDDTVYYDSDPEDVRPRTKGVRRACVDRNNAVTAEEEQTQQGRTSFSGLGLEKIALGKKLRKLDEGLIVQIVQTMRNETLTLMWHPTQSKEHPNRKPLCVKLWIESGVYLVDGSFLLPRLSWSIAYENDLGAKKLNVSKADPEQIDLLDVCRIRSTEKINRRLHPFPDPRKSFVVETQEEIFLFEAQTTEERDHIVYGYKLVIARLASLLMLRDSRAVEEFFGSTMVPGMAPI